MSEYRDVLERTRSRFQVPTLPLEEVLRRRDRRRRRQRVVAGAVAVAIAAAIAWAGTTAIRGEQQVPIQPGPSLLRTYRLLNVSDGSEAPFPAPEGGSSFRFSPGGSDVIFVKDDADGRPQLFRMRADGSDVGQITPDPEWALEADEPTLSPGGGWIAYSGVTRSGQREIIVTQPNGYHPPRASVSWGKRDARTPSWSRRGGKIAFVARGIWVLPIQHYNRGESITSGPPRLILSAGTSPAWSPTGDQIAFTLGRGSGRRLAIANADGTHVREITVPTSDHPTWSPDGGTIAYDVWSSDGQVAVWLMDLRTGGNRLLLNDASVESWKDEGTLLVSTYPGGS